MAKYKNFSLAAKELSYTPSALSHIADSLENELGVKLFIRTRKGVEITDDGKMLYEKFLKIAFLLSYPSTYPLKYERYKFL